MVPFPNPLLVLASASPRRRELLERLGLPFVVRPAGVEESSLLAAGGEPMELALALALAKARAVVREEPSALILSADTLVVVEGRILGKPKDALEAREMLAALRERAHTVVTGVALGSQATGKEWTQVTSTEVWMRAYADAEVETYIARGEPFDKAGGYAIQDAAFCPVARWAGCYCSVVGLPLGAVVQLLGSAGYRLPDPIAWRLPERCLRCLEPASALSR